LHSLFTCSPIHWNNHDTVKDVGVPEEEMMFDFQIEERKARATEFYSPPIMEDILRPFTGLQVPVIVYHASIIGQ
jgi:hypothetical protein